MGVWNPVLVVEDVGSSNLAAIYSYSKQYDCDEPEC